MSYYPAIPEIAQAYRNDPRTQMALQAIQTGSSGAPVAGGKWAWADGIARALQGAVGGYMQHKQGKKYEGEEKDLMAMYAKALGGGADGAAAPGGMGAGGPVPPQPGDPAANQQPQTPMVPQAAPQAPPAPDPLAPLPDDPSGGSYYPQAAPQVAPQIAAALGAPKPQPRPAMYTRPVGGTATSGFGKRGSSFHNGQDWDGKMGEPIRAVLGGMVEVAGPTKGPSGTMVRIKYDNGEVGGYAHMSAVNVKPGQRVEPGDAIGAVGNTGRVRSKTGDGTHLHYTHRDANGKLVNPASLPFGKPAPEGQQQQAAAAPVDTPQAPVPPQYATAEPEMPDAPQRPASRAPLLSKRLTAGQELMRSGNRFAFANALRFIEEGMGEQFQADREALGFERDIDKAEYSGAQGDYYGAKGDKRNAAYTARADERREGYALGREQRGYAQDDASQARTFAHNDANREDTQAFSASEAATDRSHQTDLTKLTIEGKRLTEQEKRQAKMQGWLGTPQGAKLYETVSKAVSSNDNVIASLDQFRDLNAQTATGGMLLNDPTGIGAWGGRTLSSDLAQMDQITNTIAPLMRQAGSGAMSDRDVEMFKKSVPNINTSRKANAGAIERVKKGMQRINDFEMSRLQAASEGNQAGFMREWSIFRSRVPIISGTTFEQWKSTIPQYDSSGKRK